jgi:hypothetical protein
MSRGAMKNTFEFILLELNMILRNRKPLNNLYQILLIYLFSILVYIYFCNKAINSSLAFYMILSLMSSSFILGHGLFLLTWESTYFNFIMTRKISIQSFFAAKYYLFLMSALILSIINIPIIIVVRGNLFLYFSFLIFNIGMIPILLISVSFYNNERASLGKGVFFNYEGYGLWQYTIFVFEVMLPGIIYMGILSIWSKYGALLILILSGFIGMTIFILNPRLFFSFRKYRIIEGFNQK